MFLIRVIAPHGRINRKMWFSYQDEEGSNYYGSR